MNRYRLLFYIIIIIIIVLIIYIKYVENYKSRARAYKRGTCDSRSDCPLTGLTIIDRKRKNTYQFRKKKEE